MRFHCPTPRERAEKKLRKLSQWRRKFAWLPIKLSDKSACVWLEFVETRYSQSWHSDFERPAGFDWSRSWYILRFGDYIVQYRAINNW